MTPPLDVAIVGGGPAGSFAAYNLARAGARVSIFDFSHPREKPCGGGVTGRALALVADALAGRLPPAVPICRARFLDPTGAESAVVPLDREALIVASRAVFDAALLDAAHQAGASVVRARVTDVAIDSTGAVVHTTDRAHRADLLIGADGANSLVRRRLAQPFRRDDLSIATGYFAHGVTSDEILIEMLDDPAGYIWSFPRPDHLAIGACVQADTDCSSSRLRWAAADWLRRTGLAERARLAAYAWPIPSLTPRSLERLTLGGARWRLIGDAAGLVDPITREGIYFALLSGQWVAHAASAANGDDYDARVRDEIVPELLRAARLKAAFFRLASSGLLNRALRHSASVNDVMADLIAGRQDYAGLKGRLLRTFEWRLAWRALLTARSIRPGPAREDRGATR